MSDYENNLISYSSNIDSNYFTLFIPEREQYDIHKYKKERWKIYLPFQAHTYEWDGH